MSERRKLQKALSHCLVSYEETKLEVYFHLNSWLQGLL